jgi:rod shape determining protein RodA
VLAFLQYIHVDFTLLLFISFICCAGLIVLYSASSQSLPMIENQVGHYLVGFGIMLTLAQISPVSLQRTALPIYLFGFSLLVVVLLFGHIGKGAQRWLNLGLVHIQPSEIMKLAIPMLLAWYYSKIHLPITTRSLLLALPIIFIPAFLTAKQPDLGTAIVLTIAGASVLFFAGLSKRIMTAAFTLLAACIPFAWYILHDYQRQRILTFLNPERDPLGKGYHIIQSKIAIGSGGIFGKGWLNGTQSHLHFLPEHTTDFIFAVCGEEFGFLGGIILITLYMLVFLRGLSITLHAQDTFSRLLAGSITFTFFVSFFTNIGMVTGILPVVGIPLPLISYGGSSMITLMASFGILMSIQTHRKLVTA